jgi:intraflagellar transport protein 140
MTLGMVSCWMADGRNRPTSTFSNNSQHNSAITILKWNAHGKRLITGDKKGLVCVWSVDTRGSLTPTRQYRRKGEITSAVFCVMPTAAQPPQQQGPIQSLLNGQRKVDNKQANSPAFFFGTERGAVVYADDLGHCTDVQQMTSSIDTMLFYEERSRLVIINRSLLLTQYQVAEDGRVSRVMQVKMSVAGDVTEKGLKCVVWASPGLLAAATHEKMVRLLDLASDESYNLSLSVVGDMLDRSDHVVCLSFGPLDRYLAVGTHCGLVVIFKYNGPIRDVSGSRAAVTPTAAHNWELHYKTAMNSPVHQLSWYGGYGAVAVVTDEGVSVLTETIMRCAMCGSLAVIQTDSHTVSIHITGSSHVWTENTNMLIQGLSVGASCFVVWNGKTARVYRVDNQLSQVEPLEPFLCSAKAMAIADASYITDEALFATEQGMVKVLNYSGVQKGSITFTDAEGAPEYLDINAGYLSVVTIKGVIQVYNLKDIYKKMIRYANLCMNNVELFHLFYYK